MLRPERFDLAGTAGPDDGLLQEMDKTFRCQPVRVQGQDHVCGYLAGAVESGLTASKGGMELGFAVVAEIFDLACADGVDVSSTAGVGWRRLEGYQCWSWVLGLAAELGG